MKPPAKPDPPAPRRQVGWTDSALHDLTWMKIHVGEWKIIRAEIERIAALEHIRLDSAVCEVQQTLGDWMRIKICRPKQIRVIFSIEQGDTLLVVQAVLRRTERTYDIIEILWKAGRKKEQPQHV